MKFREDRRKIGATWEVRVLEGTYLEGEKKHGERCIRCEGVMTI